MVEENMEDSEKGVAAFLDRLNVRYEYHRPVIVKLSGYASQTDELVEDNRGKIILKPIYNRYFEDYYIMKPDFYLPDFHVYVEVMCGGSDSDYMRRKKTYKRNNVPIIFVDFRRTDLAWKKYFVLTLKDISNARTNKIKKVINDAKALGIETTGNYL